MKNNIIEFPKENKRYNSIKQKMINLSKMLDARYDHLSELTHQIEQIEAECEDYEKKYSVLLQTYADEVGPQNVELKFYDYSSEIGIEFEPEDGIFSVAGHDRTADHHKHLTEQDKPVPPPEIA